MPNAAVTPVATVVSAVSARMLNATEALGTGIVAGGEVSTGGGSTTGVGTGPLTTSRKIASDLVAAFDRVLITIVERLGGAFSGTFTASSYSPLPPS
jgi:hypothetical protein